MRLKRTASSRIAIIDYLHNDDIADILPVRPESLLGSKLCELRDAIINHLLAYYTSNTEFARPLTEFVSDKSSVSYHTEKASTAVHSDVSNNNSPVVTWTAILNTAGFFMHYGPQCLSVYMQKGRI